MSLTFLFFNLLNSGCEEAVLGKHHMRQNNQKHFEECMIQRLCESSMTFVFFRFYARNYQPGRLKSSSTVELY
ncbi:hypothetical protein GQ457_01G027350 [Hibiscus cannabinus]